MINNAFFLKFDRSSFKSFYISALELNFTKAALKSGTTQSGISQHIAKLESELGTSLFLRQKDGLKITEAGKRLKTYLEAIYKAEESLLQDLAMDSNSLKGVVSYAMPESCLMSPHFQMMLNVKRKDFPGIELNVEMHDSDTVFQKVLNGDIDFGFITKDIDHPQIRKINFCNENYVLLCSPKQLSISKKPEEHCFINHPDFSSLYEIWCKEQFPKKRAPNVRAIGFTGKTNRILAALSMVSGGLGVTILPEHCAETLIKEKQIAVSKHFKPAQGTIYIIHREGIVMPRRAIEVINTFLGFYGKKL